MKSLTLYMSKQIAVVTLFVTFALCFAIWLTQSLRLVDLIINRGLPLSMFLYMAVLLLPRFLAIVLPIAVFCATLFTYNRLTSDSELVVMRASGVSQLALARPGLIVGAVCAGLMALLNLYLLPVTYQKFKDLEYAIRDDYSSVLLQEGVFNTMSDGITVYVRERSANGELHGILVHDNRQAERPVTMMAERGALVRTEEGPRVVLVNGNRQQVDREGGELSLLYFEKYTVDLSPDEREEGERWREPRERFLPDLLDPGDSAHEQHYRAKLLAEGHHRLASIALPLTYVAVALALVLPGSFSRRGQTRVIMVAIGLVTVLVVANLTLHNLGGRHAEVLPALYAVTMLPIALGLYVVATPMRRRTIPRHPVPGAAQ